MLLDVLVLIYEIESQAFVLCNTNSVSKVWPQLRTNTDLITDILNPIVEHVPQLE